MPPEHQKSPSDKIRGAKTLLNQRLFFQVVE